MGGNLLILDELYSGSLVHNWLSVIFNAAVVVIGHTQVGMTADHEWIQSNGSASKNGLEKNEFGTIPFINKRVGVLGTSRVVAGKSEECVTIDINRLNRLSNWPYLRRYDSWSRKDGKRGLHEWE